MVDDFQILVATAVVIVCFVAGLVAARALL